MAFLTITNGVTTLTLDVSMQGASEREPDRVGAASRSFAGNWRSDEQEYRVWDFTYPLMAQTDYVLLRNMVKGGALVTAKGDAVESAGGFTAIVRITAAAIVEDGRVGAGGWARDVQIAVMSGVAS